VTLFAGFAYARSMNEEFWNERYRGAEYFYGTEPNDFIRAEAHRIPPGPVLCLAEGEGRNAVFLAGLGHPTTAIDMSREGLRKAKELAARRGVSIEVVHADLANYELPSETYSGIVAVFAHVPTHVRRRLHAAVPRALVPGGVFLLEAYRPEQLAFGTGGPREAAVLMTKSELEEDLRGLELLVSRDVEREINEGPMHRGMSATVQIAARRGRGEG
jgi:SAM-dependent methyltransferase